MEIGDWFYATSQFKPAAQQGKFAFDTVTKTWDVVTKKGETDSL